jgi:hypothetical protein
MECSEELKANDHPLIRDEASRKKGKWTVADTTLKSLEMLQAGANNVLAALGALGIDIAFGVGNYKDFFFDLSGQ